MRSFKTLYTIAIIGVIIVSVNHANAQIQNFSGNWKIDTDKTNYGTFGKPSTPILMKISQTVDTISIERIFQSNDGTPHSYIEKLPFSGDAVENMNRTTKKTASVKWLNDRKVLVETAIYRDDSFNVSYNGTENWSLSNVGKTLMIDRIDDGDDGHSVSKMSYQKQ